MRDRTGRVIRESRSRLDPVSNRNQQISKEKELPIIIASNLLLSTCTFNSVMDCSIKGLDFSKCKLLTFI